MKFALTIPESAWEDSTIDDSDPGDRLRVTIEISGVSMHAEAFAVAKSKTELLGSPGEYEFHLSDPEADQALGLLLGESGYPPCTHTIRGREYVVLVSPFGT